MFGNVTARVMAVGVAAGVFMFLAGEINVGIRSCSKNKGLDVG